MKYGFVQPFPNPNLTVEFARLAEEAGWDGFFVWEPVWGIDAWVTLGAAALATGRIRLGTMITPLSRMRPWKLASETVTVDHLSKGRVILSVGLGALDTGFAEFGEETDRKTRAELLDEGLEVLTGLWRGQPFSFDGKRYHIRPTGFFPPPPPVQQPRIPIWVVGAFPSRKSMARVLRYDGILPNIRKPAPDGSGQSFTKAEPEDVRRIAAYAAENRPPDAGPFDIVVEGETPGDDPARTREVPNEYAAAGATWWLEAGWGAMEAQDSVEIVRRRIQQGPPK